MVSPAADNPKNIATKGNVMPQRMALRMESSLLFAPVNFESYPLNHQAARPENANTARWVICANIDGMMVEMRLPEKCTQRAA